MIGNVPSAVTGWPRHEITRQQLEPRRLGCKLLLPKAHYRFAARTGAEFLAAVAVIFSLCGVALASGPNVIMLRGWFGVFSTGLDTIADQLHAQGIKAEVAGHLQWSNAVSDILRDRSAGESGPIVLIGHSQGANNVIDMARSLETHNVKVDLLVTLSPFLQNPIPANVVKAINYYQAPGWGQPISADLGFHGKIVNINMADDTTVTHVSIDKNSKVQSEIVHEIAALAQQANERRK